MKKIIGVLCILFIIQVVVLIISIKPDNNSYSDNGQEHEQEYEQSSELRKKKIETIAPKFIEIGFSDRQANAAAEIIEKIGINEINTMKEEKNVGYDESYPNENEYDSAYTCVGRDDTQYDCYFMLFIKNNEIIHASYWGYGSKTVYYKKGWDSVHKTVHPYTDN